MLATNEKQSESAQLTPVQYEILKTNIAAILDFLVGDGHENLIEQCFELPAKCQLKDLVSQKSLDSGMLIVCSQDRNLAIESRSALRLLAEYVGKPTGDFPASVLDLLIRNPNTNPFNLASVYRLSQRVKDEPRSIVTAVVQLHEAYLGMTPLIKGSPGTNYSGFYQRLGRVPFNLDQIGPVNQIAIQSAIKGIVLEVLQTKRDALTASMQTKDKTAHYKAELGKAMSAAQLALDNVSDLVIKNKETTVRLDEEARINEYILKEIKNLRERLAGLHEQDDSKLKVLQHIQHIVEGEASRHAALDKAYMQALTSEAVNPNAPQIAKQSQGSGASISAKSAKYNHLLALQDKAIKKAQEAKLDLNKIILPLEVEIDELTRSVDYYTMERELITRFLSQIGQKDAVDIISRDYLEKLPQCLSGFINNFKQTLEAHDYWYDGKRNEFMPLTKITREERLTTFAKSVGATFQKFRDSFLQFLQLPACLIVVEQILAETIDRVTQELKELKAHSTTPTQTYENELVYQLRNQYIRSTELQSEVDLFALCRLGDLDKVREYVTQHNNAVQKQNDLGEFPLHTACSAGHHAIVKFLLSKGAKPEELDGAQGLSAFHYACTQKNLNVLENLYEHSGKKGFQTLSKRQQPVLHTAVIANQKIVVDWLLQKVGADTQAVDNEGETALHLAAQYGYPKVAARLLAKNADVNKVNVRQENPLYLAAIHLQTAVLVEFLRYGHWLKEQDVRILFNKPRQEGQREESNRLLSECLQEAFRQYNRILRVPMVEPKSSVASLLSNAGIFKTAVPSSLSDKPSVVPSSGPSQMKKK